MSDVYSGDIGALIKIQGLRAAETMHRPRSLILIKRNSACNKGRQVSRIIRKSRYVLPGWLVEFIDAGSGGRRQRRRTGNESGLSLGFLRR